MAHFYGTLQGNRGTTTRCGSAKSGLTTHSASWNGAVRVHLYKDKDGNDCYRIEETPWQGHGQHKRIAEGIFGEP